MLWTCGIAKRLRGATANDSSVNAIVIIDSFAQIVPFAIEESLEELRFLYSPFAFKVIGETNCPMYKKDDEFKLSGNALSLKLDKADTFISTAIVRFPYGRAACRILTGDLTNVLIHYNNVDKIPLVEMECSGCGEFIRMQAGYEKHSVSNLTPIVL